MLYRDVQAHLVGRLASSWFIGMRGCGTRGCGTYPKCGNNNGMSQMVGREGREEHTYSSVADAFCGEDRR